MGLDFVTKCTPSFQRSWDQNWVELQEPDLFRRQPQVEERTFRLSLADGIFLQVGEQILLRWHADELVAFRGRVRLGAVANPPLALREAIQQACGTVCAQVRRIHPRSGAADISVVR